MARSLGEEDTRSLHPPRRFEENTPTEQHASPLARRNVLLANKRSDLSTHRILILARKIGLFFLPAKSGTSAGSSLFLDILTRGFIHRPGQKRVMCASGRVSGFWHSWRTAGGSRRRQVAP